MYAVASTANLGIPVIGKLLPLMGALPIPESLQEMKKFIAAIQYRIKENKCVVIYPEAHVWPFCNFVRPFPITSLQFPVSTKSPSFCMTTTYQKRRMGKKPKITVYIDGPFWPDHSLKEKEQQKKLCREIYDCMVKLSSNSTYEYIQYEKEPEA
jgi:1-acyl-sn-glycerol-3-phosphate acyltransferase